VLDQPYEHFELIIVNDGSTDPDTHQILATLRHPKISIVHQKNKGLARARNGGIRAAKGKYILPIDADDKIRPACLTRSVEVLESKPNIAMVYGNIQYFGDQNCILRTPRFNTYRALWVNCFVVSSMFRRSVWEEVGGYTEDILGFEDWEFWLKLIERGWTFEKVEEVLFMYHKRSSSDYHGSVKIYKDIIAQIRSLHPQLYSTESMKRLKKENQITWFEDMIYRIPLPLRERIGKYRLRFLGNLIKLSGLYRY
jgi:glycosyltransferase involved in cell wall biosynthesis